MAFNIDDQSVLHAPVVHCVSKKACDYIFCNNWNNCDLPRL